MKHINIDFQQEVESTNRVIKLRKDTHEGQALVAFFQTIGKGMGANQWESEAGKNITGSIVLEPKFLHPSQAFLLSMAVSCGIIEFLRENSIIAKIKWPNDIYIDNCKIAGILIENEFKGKQITRTIAGIGLNVNQTKFTYAPNPTSLKLITGNQYEPRSLAEKLFVKIYGSYKNLQQNFKTINEKYHNALMGKDIWLNYRDQAVQFQGKIQHVEEDGQIRIIDQSNTIRGYYFKEVEMLIDTTP